MAILFLAPWPVAYAYDDGAAAPGLVQIQVAEYSTAPSATAFGMAIGGVTPGDLFYIDAGDYPADIVITLHITNTQQLIHCYRYMTLKVGLYIQAGDGKWQGATLSDGSPIPDTYITLRNGQVSFTLAGYTEYKVAIDGGCFYCFGTNTDIESMSPQFYLTVDRI